MTSTRGGSDRVRAAMSFPDVRSRRRGPVGLQASSVGPARARTLRTVSRTLTSEALQQLGEIFGQRRFEREPTSVDRVRERQAMRVERLTRKHHRALRVLPLADERMPALRCLNANLVALPGMQPYFEKRRIGEGLQHAVVADRLYALSIVCIRHRLLQRIVVPREMVAPSATRRTRAAMDDRPVDAIRFSARELILERLLCRRGLREHDDPRR